MLTRAFLLTALLSLASPAAPRSAPRSSSSKSDAAAPKPSIEVFAEAQEEEPSPPIPQAEERRSIGDFIRDHSGEIRECYAKRLQERPTLQGKLVARFDIGPAGRVIGAAADGIADRELQLCVVRAIRAWEFARPQSGGKLRVAYPFKFEPQPAR